VCQDNLALCVDKSLLVHVLELLLRVAVDERHGAGTGGGGEARRHLGCRDKFMNSH
jgi:hypothetical protein